MGLVHKASTNGHLHILKYCLEQAAAHDILTDEVMTQLLHVVCKGLFLFVQIGYRRVKECEYKV